MRTPIIVLEFNELCPNLMDQFIAEGCLPNFAELKRRSHVYTTEAGEIAPYLEPWIQWVTVHTGLPYSEHQVFDLGDGAKLQVPHVWDIVGERGDKVWICGSMNATFRRPIDGFILPDPWSTGIQAYPDNEFDDFFDFVRLNVQEHTRDHIPAQSNSKIRFIRYMLAHGMTASTVTSIIEQLVSERKGHNRWKRATILDSLAWDVFKFYWDKHRPAFSTFFLNSTAHFQHMYWRNMQPDVFESKPTPEEQTEYSGAVRLGYEHMDKIVGKCLEMAGSTATIVLASALSQQPCLKYEHTGGKVFYRINDADALFRHLQISPRLVAPVMSEQLRLHFETEAQAEDAHQKLSALRLNGEPMMLSRRSGTEVFTGCSVFTRVERNATVSCGLGDFRFFEHFYDCRLVKSGMHHPDGILWIALPGETPSSTSAERVPLTAVAPTLLALMETDVPAAMRGPVLDCAMQPKNA